MMERMVKVFLIKQVWLIKSYNFAPLERIKCVNLTEEEEICRIQVRNY
jgi:hypothetical protein